MAGEGTRFSKDGYKLPKALIPVSGEPMIVQVIRTLPQAEKWVFVVRKEHVEQYNIDAVIKKEIPDAVIIPLEETTEGQASTCMLALEDVPDDEEVFIAACDNSFLFNETKFNALRERDDVDAVIWTFSEDKLLTDNPEAWGWLRVEEDNETITDVSVKIPVSDDPYTDHAVVATFYFKQAGEFKEAYNTMYAEDHRINGEFYVDSMPTFYKKLGKKSVIFDVDLYVGWGKPSDLYDYQLREYTHSIGKETDENWNTFFKKLLMK